MKRKIFKFGGVLLNQIDGFTRMRDIVINEMNEQNSLILVISAFQKTTSNLLLAAKIAANNEKNEFNMIFNNITEYHTSLAHLLIKDNDNLDSVDKFLQQNYTKLKNLLTGVYITKELSPRTQDLILSFGEIFASNIVYSFLKEAINNINVPYITTEKTKNYDDYITLFNILEILQTDDNYGNAQINLSISIRNINEILVPKLNNHRIIITQGFIAKNKLNEVTTMGYESSNLTAAVLAVAINADEFIIWTDTEGIYQTDPNIFHNTKQVPCISFDKAILLAKYGLKTLHKEMISILKKFNKEVKFCSGYNPNGKHTIISANNSINNKFAIFNNLNSDNSDVRQINLIDCNNNVTKKILQCINNHINE